MPNHHAPVGRGGTTQHHKLFLAASAGSQAGETLTVTCYACGMPSSIEWAEKVSIRPTSPTALAKPYFPSLSKGNPPPGGVVAEDGSTFLCAFCHASLEAQWYNYEKSPSPIAPKDREYDTHNFTCAVCSVQTYRKRVRALPFQEFPFLTKDRQPGSITLGDNPLAVVCLDCSETLWAQSAEYDRWGLPIQKRHFNWMTRPPPPENSMEATVARLPSGETHLPRCPPIIRSRALIDPRHPNTLITTTAASQLASAKSKSNNSNVGISRERTNSNSMNMGRKGSAPALNIPENISSIQPSQPPVVTVAPMSSHRNSSSIRRGSCTSIPPNLVSSSSKLYPVNVSSGPSSYSQSQSPPSSTNRPAFPIPNYTPYAWTKRENEEGFPSFAAHNLEQHRTTSGGSVWNWIAPQSSDLLRYQTYLSSLEGRNYTAPESIYNPTTHGIHHSNLPGQSIQPHCFLPPPFLPTSEFRQMNRNASPPQTYNIHQEEESSNHYHATKARNLYGNNQQVRNHRVSPERHASNNRNSGDEDIKSRRKELEPEPEEVKKILDKETKSSIGIGELDVLKAKSEHNKHQDSKLLPKKRKYHFESSADSEGHEPMDYSTSNSEGDKRERKDSSNSLSIHEKEDNKTPVPVSSGDIAVKSDIPKNFMIAYLCNQATPSPPLGKDKECPDQKVSKENGDERCVSGRNSSRGSVIVSTQVHGSGNNSPSGKDEEADIKPKFDSTPTPVYDKEILVYKSKPTKVGDGEGVKSVSASSCTECCKEEMRANEKLGSQSPNSIGKASGVSSPPRSDVNSNDVGRKNEEDAEAFVQETLEVFKKEERIRCIEREKEIRRKLDFLRKLDLVTLQDKSDVELRLLISRHERNTLPPLKFRPDENQKPAGLDANFEKQIIKTTMVKDRSLRQKNVVADQEQLSFLKNLTLKPASRAEKFRREHEWRLFLLERKLRERRDFNARGLRKPWDNGVDLGKLIHQNGKILRRNSNPFFGRGVGQPKIHGMNSFNGGESGDLLDLYGKGGYGRKMSSSSEPCVASKGVAGIRANALLNNHFPIINYPKYIPSYSTGKTGSEETKARVELEPTSKGEKQDGSGDQQQTGGTGLRSGLRMTSFPSEPPKSGAGSPLGKQQTRSVQPSPLTIPKLPMYNPINSVANCRGSDMESGADSGDSSSDKEKQEGRIVLKDFYYPDAIEEGREMDLTSNTLRQRQQQRTPNVGPIIQGYSDYWMKTKRDIEEIISPRYVKTDKRSRRLAAYELKRLRKTLASHQTEMKILERKLRNREREIQLQLGIGQNTHHKTSTRLG